jgi:hypothetical protein
VNTNTVRKSPADLPETATILRLLAEIAGRQPPAPAVVSEPSDVSAREFLGRVNWRNEPSERVEQPQPIDVSNEPGVNSFGDPFAGRRVLTLTPEFLAGLAASLESACGPTAGAVAKSCGRAWGRRLAGRLAESANGLSLAFNHHGWGLLTLDFNRLDRGLVAAELRHASVGLPEGLLAGLLAGLFSHFAGLALDCIPTQRPDGAEDVARFVIGLPQRLDRFAEAAGQGRSHDEILNDLETARA